MPSPMTARREPTAPRAALKQLKREQEHAEALAEARAALASVTSWRLERPHCRNASGRGVHLAVR